MNEVKIMRKSTLKLSEKLNEKNKEIFGDIICYFRVSNLKEYEQEDILSDLLEMFLRCEKENKNIEDVIGEDFKEFCDSIIEATNNNNNSLLSKLMYNINTIFYMMFIVLTVDTGFYYLENIKSSTHLNYKFTFRQLTTILVCVLISFLIDSIGKNSFKLSKIKFSKKANFLFGTLIGGYICFIMFCFKLSKYIVFSINIYYIFLIILVYWIFKFITNNANKNFS